MKRLDLIINALELASYVPRGVMYPAGHHMQIAQALAAARELRELEPVGYMDSRGVLFNKTIHPHLHTALYALDEVTK